MSFHDQSANLARKLQLATTPGARGKLVARGLARGMVWRDGQLPADAPAFSPTLTTDLLDHGFTVLSQALALRDTGGDPELLNAAFRTAAEAIESAARKADSRDADNGFHLLVAATAFHLGHYAARSYCLIPSSFDTLNLSSSERGLAFLLRRDLRGMRLHCMRWLNATQHSDADIERRLLEDPDFDSEDVLSLALTRQLLRGLATFEYALQMGDPQTYVRARALFVEGAAVASQSHFVPHWWVHTLTRHLIDDLWDLSLHMRLPRLPENDGDAAAWNQQRASFIAAVGCRDIAQIELWPSQLAAAQRAIALSDDLVVALPTSAGKTRIAELCILRALASKKRVIYVTPLRALSAQVEHTLGKSFRPLGYSVSSLYGAAGVAAADIGSLKASNIVVATPEKLDFAIRQQPSVIDDVALVVLDEGHMIGLGVREIRYEVLVQRLLKRTDAASRRLVCLSAIFKAGDTFDDFTAWLRDDVPGTPVVADWRPTRQRPAILTWNGQSGRLSLSVDDEQPYVPRFLSAEAPKGRRKNHFPQNAQELIAATAKALHADNHRVLIYCPERRSVEPLAEQFLKLYKQGHFPSLLADQASISNAKRLGLEWLGPDHVAVRALDVGLAVHHGALPRPFLSEIESLLNERALPIAIASPTLAQGLDLSCSALIFSSLHRGGKLVEPSEFANVIGRAGRAYVDLDGLTVLPIFDPADVRRRSREFVRLLRDADNRSMESGLFQLISQIAQRIATAHSMTTDQVIEYAANQSTSWHTSSTSESHEEVEADSATQSETPLEDLLAELDAAILSTVDPLDTPIEQLATTIDTAMKGSLWRRRLQREDAEGARLQNAIIIGRARWLWSNTDAARRRGYFAAGLGHPTGSRVDAWIDELLPQLVSAEASLFRRDHATAAQLVVQLATKLLTIYPFMPKKLPARWMHLVEGWLAGSPLSSLLSADDAAAEVQFIQDTVVYRLVWAVEALRVHAVALGRVEAVLLSGAVAYCLTYGAPSPACAVLVEAGLHSRHMAVRVITTYDLSFNSTAEVFAAIPGLDEAVHRDNLWATDADKQTWRDFSHRSKRTTSAQWRTSSVTVPVTWRVGFAPIPGQRLRVIPDVTAGSTYVCGDDLIAVGVLIKHLPDLSMGWVSAVVTPQSDGLVITKWGP